VISVSSESAAEGAACRKITKYSTLASTRCFVPLAFETFGPICESGLSFFDDLGGRLAAVTGNPRERSFLYQRLSIAIQQGNAICFSNSFCRSVDAALLNVGNTVSNSVIVASILIHMALACLYAYLKFSPFGCIYLTALYSHTEYI